MESGRTRRLDLPGHVSEKFGIARVREVTEPVRVEDFEIFTHALARHARARRLKTG